MRLWQRLVAGTLGVVILLVAFIVVVVDQQLSRRLRDETVRSLARDARLVSTQWTADADPGVLAHRAGDALGHRVTLIRPDGVVIGDTDFSPEELTRLENHSTRPEVVAARAGGEGWSMRPSTSRGDNELYVAVSAPRGIARVSEPMQALDEIVSQTRRDVAAVGVLALFGALALAWLFSRAVSRPVVELRDIAVAMAEGDLSRRPALPASGEVEELGLALRQLAEQLSARIAALRGEEATLVQLTEALEQGVVAVDGRQMVVRINETGRRLLGLRTPLPFPLDHLPRRRELREALAAALAGGATDGVEVVIDGHVLSATARPLASGGAVLAFFDLTLVRRLETVRRDFVANVSHELRTPLTVVGGFAETLAHDNLGAADRQQFAQRILANTRRMQRIVDDLLDLSRIESGGWVPNPEPVDLDAIATEALAASGEAAASKGLVLEKNIAPDARLIDADPTALRQVLGNLIDNAVRHTSAGSIVVFSRRRDDGGVTVGVRDTGSGIAAEHLPRIFERFYRADPGRSREEGGTGLGLSIVKHLVEAHGATVQAESAFGAWTMVSAHFPPPGPNSG